MRTKKRKERNYLILGVLKSIDGEYTTIRPLLDYAVSSTG
jgi:hypothetical protein